MENRNIWHIWAEKLHRWGVESLVVSWLEIAGPINIIGAQFIHISFPVLRDVFAEEQILALTNLLENPSVAKNFVAYLDKEDYS